MRHLEISLTLKTPAEQEGQVGSFALTAVLVTHRVLVLDLLQSSLFSAIPQTSLKSREWLGP